MSEPRIHDQTPPEPLGKDAPPAPAAHGTYNDSVRLPDQSGLTPDNSPPPGAFVNPDKGSTMINEAWEKQTKPRG